MAHVSERRKKPRQKPVRESEAIWITLRSVSGSTGDVRARVVDASDTGLRIEAPMALTLNAAYSINAGSVNGNSQRETRARVVWCNSASSGLHVAGLAYENSQEPERKPVEAMPDYYEVLQVHSKADPDTIHRVYRLLAQRFHPDNGETGNPEIFRSILEAYRVLSDPEKRAAYDVNLLQYRQVRWRVFDQGQAATGKASEISKRRGVLELLYTCRMNQPNHPAMTLIELEDLLDCPREHLEFALWYLKENALIARGDNGRYSITAKGVDYAEVNETPHVQNERLLPSAPAAN